MGLITTWFGFLVSGDNVKAWQPEKTMQLFQQMQQEGMTPNRFTLFQFLNACANLQALEVGGVHSMNRRWFKLALSKLALSMMSLWENSLIDMYAKCGSMDNAWRVFKNMPSLTVVSWTLWYLDMWNVGRATRHWKFFSKCNR
jgi:pentatricopeptide repeat protein